MKHLLLYFCLLIAMTNVLAQSPSAFNYQAVIRDSNNNVITNQSTSLRLSILQGGVTGPAVYSETFAAATNAYGVVNLQVGNGTVVSGVFNQINWGNGIYFLQVEVDVTGGTNYQVIGTSQFLSVPYALYAETAGNTGDHDVDSTNEIQQLTKVGLDIILSDGGTVRDSIKTYVAGNGLSMNGDTVSIDTSNTLFATKHYVGELWGGGIVCYTYNKGQNGLVMSLDNLSNSFAYASGSASTGATSYYDGETNTASIITTHGSNTAAGICDTYSAGGYNDWYLPASFEFVGVGDDIFLINMILETDGDPNTNPMDVGLSGTVTYWTSTEALPGSAFSVYVDYGQGAGSPNFGMQAYGIRSKTDTFRVRAMRKF